MATTLIATSAARAEYHWLFRQSRTPRLRSIEEFAAQEFVIPKGLYKGTLVNWDIQPFARLLVRELDSGGWRRSAVVGCVQSGKSLFSFVLPAMYYAFECREPVIVFAPTMKVDRDKWKKELLPAILASRYRRFLPTDGSGSRGGWAEEIELTNGGTFKFMSAGGGDENRSSYTARCVVGTEVDKMDEAGQTSRETDPVSQIEARTHSYPEELRRFHVECTVSVPGGRIWLEYQSGTASRIACPCPHCGDWVTPEREHLVGWQETDSELAARQAAWFACPACGEKLSEADRVAMNRAANLLHRGQTIAADGSVTGPKPETDTLGFRWNAFNNLFWTPGEVAAKEWAARHATASAEDAAERELCQFVWAVPYESPEFDATPLDANQIRRRFADRRFGKGLVPEDTEQLALSIDLGKRYGTWTLMAWRAGARRHICDYGTFEVPSRDIEVQKALAAALRNFRDDVVLEGWHTTAGEVRLPAAVFIDAGWMGDVVFDFCRDKESGNRFRPAIGYGQSQLFRRYRTYRKPAKTGTEVKLIGEEYHVVWVPAEKLFRVDLNVDHWKTQLFEGLRLPPGSPGSVEFYWSSDPNEHISVAKHYTAERQQEVFTPGVGSEVRWIRMKRDNHYLDNGSNVLCALHLLGARLLPKIDQTPPPAAARPIAEKPFLTPAGMPYLLTDRQ
jgi:phage terminase large subunit GpA-like protein